MLGLQEEGTQENRLTDKLFSIHNQKRDGEKEEYALERKV